MLLCLSFLFWTKKKGVNGLMRRRNAPSPTKKGAIPVAHLSSGSIVSHPRTALWCPDGRGTCTVMQLQKFWLLILFGRYQLNSGGINSIRARTKKQTRPLISNTGHRKIQIHRQSNLFYTLPSWPPKIRSPLSFSVIFSPSFPSSLPPILHFSSRCYRKKRPQHAPRCSTPSNAKWVGSGYQYRCLSYVHVPQDNHPALPQNISRTAPSRQTPHPTETHQRVEGVGRVPPSSPSISKPIHQGKGGGTAACHRQSLTCQCVRKPCVQARRRRSSRLSSRMRCRWRLRRIL